MFSQTRTTTEQGNIGEGYAIAYFTKTGAIISKPLFVNTLYDLVVDAGKGLKRVQVKTTRQRSIQHPEQFLVNIKSSGSNARVTKTIGFDRNAVDILFVLSEAGDMWVIPAEVIQYKHVFALSPEWDKYKVRL